MSPRADGCNYHTVTDSDAEKALAVGGWDPRHARVLEVQVQGDVAAALVDANGDGADLNVDMHVRQADGEWGRLRAATVRSAFQDGWLVMPPTID